MSNMNRIKQFIVILLDEEPIISIDDSKQLSKYNDYSILIDPKYSWIEVSYNTFDNKQYSLKNR